MKQIEEKKFYYNEGFKKDFSPQPMHNMNGKNYSKENTPNMSHISQDTVYAYKNPGSGISHVSQNKINKTNNLIEQMKKRLIEQNPNVANNSNSYLAD